MFPLEHPVEVGRLVKQLIHAYDELKKAPICGRFLLA